MDAFEFIMPGKIVFGAGKLSESGASLAELGKKGLIVCDAWCNSTGLPARLAEIMKEAGVESVIL